MQTQRNFNANGSRYAYDFGLCSTKTGWAQVDTSQDASYFGTWANPETLQIFTYCEGDETLQTAESAAEFAVEVRHIADWTKEQGHEFKGIDPGFDDALAARFCEVELGDLLH